MGTLVKVWAAEVEKIQFERDELVRQRDRLRAEVFEVTKWIFELNGWEQFLLNPTALRGP